MYYQKFLYIFFLVLALNLSFFSTNKVIANAFLIDEIEISEKLENNFNKDILINKGFEKAFKELMVKLIQSKDLDKIEDVSLNEIKSMIETFSIKKEKFINNNYSLNLGVSFNKKKIFNYLDTKNIFPAQIIEKKFLFIPIIIDQSKPNLLVFSNNPIYENWKKDDNKSYLIDYILPTEDLEDLNLIKKNYLELENYNFEDIIKKYYLENSIIALIFRDDNQIKILSKIKIKDNKVIKSNSFKDIDLNDPDSLKNLINNLKVIYEDFWKESNLINTSIKLKLSIKVKNNKFELSSKFEETLGKIDLISSYSISMFDKNFIYYDVIFNGTTNNFINIMENKDYNFDIQKKTWILK